MGLDIRTAVANTAVVGRCSSCGRECEDCAQDWIYVDGPSVYFAYVMFTDLRVKLAREDGIDLRSMWGFGGFGRADATLKPWADVDSRLEPLLNHSDCAGELTTEQCAEVAPRLREILESPHWAALLRMGFDDQECWEARRAADLLTVLEACAEHGWTAVFS